jgi:ERCC4 domain
LCCKIPKIKVHLKNQGKSGSVAGVSWQNNAVEFQNLRNHSPKVKATMVKLETGGWRLAEQTLAKNKESTRDLVTRRVGPVYLPILRSSATILRSKSSFKKHKKITMETPGKKQEPAATARIITTDAKNTRESTTTIATAAAEAYAANPNQLKDGNKTKHNNNNNNNKRACTTPAAFAPKEVVVDLVSSGNSNSSSNGDHDDHDDDEDDKKPPPAKRTKTSLSSSSSSRRQADRERRSNNNNTAVVSAAAPAAAALHAVAAAASSASTAAASSYASTTGDDVTEQNESWRVVLLVDSREPPHFLEKLTALQIDCERRPLATFDYLWVATTKRKKSDDSSHLQEHHNDDNDDELVLDHGVERKEIHDLANGLNGGGHCWSITQRRAALENESNRSHAQAFCRTGQDCQSLSLSLSL